MDFKVMEQTLTDGSHVYDVIINHQSVQIKFNCVDEKAAIELYFCLEKNIVDFEVTRY